MSGSCGRAGPNQLYAGRTDRQMGGADSNQDFDRHALLPASPGYIHAKIERSKRFDRAVRTARFRGGKGKPALHSGIPGTQGQAGRAGYDIQDKPAGANRLPIYCLPSLPAGWYLSDRQ